MKRVTHRFLRFYSPGSLFAETFQRELEGDFDPLTVEWPDAAYAFTLHQRVDVTEGEEVFVGVEEQIGPMYFHLDSLVESYEEVEKSHPSADILLSNMRNNGWDRIVWSRWGNWPQPYDADHHVIVGSN